MKIVYTEQARHDLRAIRNYGRISWGQARATEYQTVVRSRIRQLASFPELGPVRLDLDGPMRQLVVERHVILYRIEGPNVVIDRIVHERKAISLDALTSDRKDDFERLRRSLEEARAQYEQGNYTPLSPSTIDEIARRAEERRARGIPVSDDVKL